MKEADVHQLCTLTRVLYLPQRLNLKEVSPFPSAPQKQSSEGPVGNLMAPYNPAPPSPATADEPAVRSYGHVWRAFIVISSVPSYADVHAPSCQLLQPSYTQQDQWRLASSERGQASCQAE